MRIAKWNIYEHRGVNTGVTIATWPHAQGGHTAHLYTWTGGAAGEAYKGTWTYESLLLLLSLLHSFSGCRRKMEGIGSSICCPSYPAFLFFLLPPRLLCAPLAPLIPPQLCRLTPSHMPPAAAGMCQNGEREGAGKYVMSFLVNVWKLFTITKLRVKIYGTMQLVIKYLLKIVFVN